MQGLPLNVAYIILDWIFSRDFKAQGLRNIPTTKAVLTESFHADATTNVHS